MTTISSSSATAATTNLATTRLALPAGSSEREQLSAASKQFEAIFVNQMLAAARKANLGGDDLFGGQGLETFREMQDKNFADIMAQSGALGFATQIEAQIARFLPPGPTTVADGTK